MNKQDLIAFKQLLLARKAALVNDARRLADGTLGSGKGEPATRDITDYADLGSDCFEQELGLDLLENHQKALEEINDALLRIESGTFGLCATCRKPIPRARLKALPYARLCLDCKRREEQFTEGRA